MTIPPLRNALIGEFLGTALLVLLGDGVVASVVLLNKQAEAEPLRQQVAAFGDGNAYAQYFFFQKLAPSVKSILTNTEGPFADLFHQLSAPLKTAPASQGQKQLTEASHDSH